MTLSMRETAFSLGLSELSQEAIAGTLGQMLTLCPKALDDCVVERMFARKVKGQFLLLVQTDEDTMQDSFTLITIKADDRGSRSPQRPFSYFRIVEIGPVGG